MASTAASPSAPQALPPVIGSLPPLRRPNRVPVLVAVVAVGVAIVLLLVLVVGPILTGAGGGGSGGGVEMTYSAAKPIADGAMSRYQGGGWGVIVGSGLAPSTATTVRLNASSFTSSSNCTLNLSLGISTSLTIPAFNGSRSSGVAPLWIFLYRNLAGTVALVAVENSAATIVGTIGGSLCTTIFRLVAPVPSNVIDSPAVAAAVATAAAPFLALHPNASTEYGVLGGISFGTLGTGPEWTIGYTTCSPLNTTSGGFGDRFNATLNATTGQLLSTQTLTGVACGTAGSTPLGSALAFGTPSVVSYSTYTNVTFPVTLTSSTVTWASFTPSLENGSTLAPITYGWSVTGVSSLGNPIATYSPASHSWSGTSSATILLTDQMVLTTAFNPSGDLLVLTGNGAFTGTITLFIP